MKQIIFEISRISEIMGVKPLTRSIVKEDSTTSESHFIRIVNLLKFNKMFTKTNDGNLKKILE